MLGDIISGRRILNQTTLLALLNCIEFTLNIFPYEGWELGNETWFRLLISFLVKTGKLSVESKFKLGLMADS